MYEQCKANPKSSMFPSFVQCYPLYFFKYKFIYFNWRLINLQYCIGFAIYQCESAMGVHVFPTWTPLLPPFPYHPSGSSQCTNPRSCIMHWPWSGDSFHVWYYICFNAILPNHPTLSPSYRAQMTVLYICVSFSVLHTGLSLPSF